MVKIAIAGVCGKMGSRIATISGEYEGLALAGAFERAGHKDIGRDAGEAIGIGHKGVVIATSAAEALASADLLIDFTAPEATLANMEAASKLGKAMVIGTTGMKKEQIALVAEMSKKIPCMMASNMSLGVNLLLKVLGDIARALGDPYDVEIVETHHRLKKDAPSGTAIMMARAIADAMGRDLEKDAVYARHGIIGERTRKEIGIQTLRAGDVVGDHTVIFGGLGERIEVTHRASSRDVFARGAIKAALWLAGKPAGLYDMQDVLGLKG